ncbi:MAG: hypothetical protein H7Y04_16185, partial [Verrucomicrobia bacterium]|nr:hypothetical protein [Cytophagales bacterium]
MKINYILKLRALIIVFFFVSTSSFAQYFNSTGSSSGYGFQDRTNPSLFYTLYSTGNSARLFSGTNGDLFSVTNTGNFGIGVPNSRFRLSLGGSVNNTKLALWDDLTGNQSYGLGIQSLQFRFHLGSASARFSFFDLSDGREIFTIRGNGQVGINTGNSIPAGFMLAVKGSVLAEEVRVRLSTNWPDYVFQSAYKLKPLAEV